MTAPKLKPCPECGGQVSVYTYDSGWRRAECDESGCTYIATPAENIVRATRNHNLRAARQAAAQVDAHTLKEALEVIEGG